MSGGSRSALPSGEQPRWTAIRAWTLAALAEMIAKAEDTVSLTMVKRQSVEMPRQPWLTVDTDVKAPPGGWRAIQFFLIDADTKDASKPRKVRVESKFPPKAQRIVLDLTREVRRNLGTTTHVRVGCTDNIELDLLLQLQVRLKETASRAPRVEELWSATAPGDQRERVPDGFNDGQARALRAILAGGGWLLWGPPGTGKTTVIVGAVREALRRGWTVLIASHTHVAVDNVVKDVASEVEEAGILVRVGTEGKVDPKVVAHPWLLLDKAAAVITRLEERKLELDEAQRQNDEHPARDRLVEVNQLLGETDEALYHRAKKAAVAQEQHSMVVVDISSRKGALARLEQQRDSLHASAEALAARAFPLTALIAAQRNARVAAQRASQRRTEISTEIALRQADLKLAQEAAAECARRATRWTARLPWARADSEAAVVRSAESVRAVEITLDQLSATARQLAGAVDRQALEERRLEPLIAACRDADAQWAACNNALQRAVERVSDKERQLAEVSAKEMDLRRIATSVGEPNRILSEMSSANVPGLLDERETLNDAVTALDAEHAALTAARAQLADLYRNTKKKLLEEAPVMACTLSSLTTKSELANRRFDLVIIDEAASASIPQLMYAGSKAERSVAFVGDFLQNEPIIDVADAITDEQRALRPWLGEIFGLLDIADRAGAESHPRCLPLRVQYRFPSTIANIVNQFCYDGLLESNRQVTEDDGIFVTFIDTAGHPGQALQRSGKSWIDPLGVDIMRVLVNACPRTSTIGLVSPYAAHADAASRCARREKLPIEMRHGPSFPRAAVRHSHPRPRAGQ